MVHIDTLTREAVNKNEKYKCISCEKELIPKLGKINKHHFAHKEIVTCSGETYLHLLGRKLFYEEYNYCIDSGKPFFIELRQKQECNANFDLLKEPCYLGSSLTKFDLTTYFPKRAMMQKRDGSFIPDVMLVNDKNQKIFIEIAVTHFSSEKKISSENKIIEMFIETEEDLEPIRQHTLSVENSQIEFINFNAKDLNGNHCGGMCPNKFDLFIVRPDGGAIMYQLTLEAIRTYLTSHKEKYIHYCISKDVKKYPLKFKYYVAKSYADKIKISNCFICRYHEETNNSYVALSDDNDPIFCKIAKSSNESNFAKDCQYYRPDEEYIHEHIENGGRLLEYSKFYIVPRDTDEGYDDDYMLSDDDY